MAGAPAGQGVLKPGQHWRFRALFALQSYESPGGTQMRPVDTQQPLDSGREPGLSPASPPAPQTDRHRHPHPTAGPPPSPGSSPAPG